MPGNPPSVSTEREALVAYLVQQRDGLKYAAYGLSEIDGPTVYELMAAAEGWPETDWLKPWRPKVDAEPPRRPNLDKDSSVEPNEG